MSAALLEGVSVGLLLSALVGPVFFSLIQSSLTFGFRYAVALAFGILVSDSLYVLISYYGIKLLSDVTYFETILGYVGGVILIGFGISSLVRKQVSRPNSGGIVVPNSKKSSAFVKGFSINGINPFVLLFWISIASVIHMKETFDRLDIGLYYFGVLGTVFSIDLLKAYIAKKLAHLVTPKMMGWLNKAVGLIMVGFGLRMLIYTYMN